MEALAEGISMNTLPEKDGWLVDGGLLYQLKDGANYNEINVTMVAGSRSEQDRKGAALYLANLLEQSVQPNRWVNRNEVLEEIAQAMDASIKDDSDISEIGAAVKWAKFVRAMKESA
jgi:hypothetical protein